MGTAENMFPRWCIYYLRQLVVSTYTQQLRASDLTETVFIAAARTQGSKTHPADNA